MSHDLTPWLRAATDAEVDPLIDAEVVVLKGQYGLARGGLLRLAATSDDDDVRAAARRLLRSTAPDPAASVVWLVLVSFITCLLVVYVSP
jgi:hypothetical protein